MKVRNLVFALSFALSTAAFAADETSTYNLMNPMPSDQMGAMASDRIGQIPSTQTVAPGHFQVEMDAVNYSYYEQNGAKAYMTKIAPLTLKAGIMENLDAQIGVATFTRKTQGDTSIQGFGDMSASVKWTAFRDSELSNLSIALQPTVRFPTAQDAITTTDYVEYGLTAPISIDLPAEIKLGASVAANWHATNGRSLTKNVNWSLDSGLAISRNIASSLNGYVGFTNSQSLVADAKWVASANAGLTYDVSRDFAVDAGSNFGLTEMAADFNPYVGASVRF